jgi:hypothetical protein
LPSAFEFGGGNLIDTAVQNVDVMSSLYLHRNKITMVVVIDLWSKKLELVGFASVALPDELSTLFPCRV